MNPINALFKALYLLTALFVNNLFINSALSNENPTRIVIDKSKSLVELQTNEFYDVLVPPEPDINARAYILIDANTGVEIASKNPNEKYSPASLTKMLSTYIAEILIDQGKLSFDDIVKVSRKARYSQGSRTFLNEGDEVSVLDILKGVIVQSGNDATVAIAEYIAESESNFVLLMNDVASQIGMRNSNFADSTGINEDITKQYSTAHDLALLSTRVVLDYPETYRLYSIKEFEYNNINQRNRNRLLWQDDSVDGIKTGSFPQAKWFTMASSAKRGDMRLIAIVLGTRNQAERNSESLKLLNYGFNYFTGRKIYNKWDVLQDTTVQVWQGKQQYLNLAVDRDVHITIPKGSEHLVSSVLKLPKHIIAPIKKGEPLGSMELKLNDSIIGKLRLVASMDVEQAGFFRRIWDRIVYFFSYIFNTL